METRQKVLFYGNSLLLAGMQASLQACPGFEVTSLDGLEAETELLPPDPSVVIFDLGSVSLEFLPDRVQALPGVLLIGVDAESHTVLLGGQAAGSISLEQIAQILSIHRSDEVQPSCACA